MAVPWIAPLNRAMPLASNDVIFPPAYGQAGSPIEEALGEVVVMLERVGLLGPRLFTTPVLDAVLAGGGGITKGGFHGEKREAPCSVAKCSDARCSAGPIRRSFRMAMRRCAAKAGSSRHDAVACWRYVWLARPSPCSARNQKAGQRTCGCHHPVSAVSFPTSADVSRLQCKVR